MSWEDILKNTTKEAEQFVEDYMSAYDVWFEECNKVHQQNLEQVEEGHRTITYMKEKFPEELNNPTVKDMVNRASETNNQARQKIYEIIDTIKGIMDRIETLKEAMVGVPTYVLLDTLVKNIPAEPMITGVGSYPNSPSYDLQKAEDLLHRLSFEGSGRRDFT